MRRGEVWWTSQPAPVGHRPVVLLSRNEAYQVRTHVAVANVTTRMRGISVEVALGSEEELPKSCVVNVDTISTIPKRILARRMGALSPEKVRQLNKALMLSLGLDE